MKNLEKDGENKAETYLDLTANQNTYQHGAGESGFSVLRAERHQSLGRKSGKIRAWQLYRYCRYTSHTPSQGKGSA